MDNYYNLEVFMGKKIICAGILDTKGEEIKYIAEQVKAAG